MRKNSLTLKVVQSGQAVIFPTENFNILGFLGNSPTIEDYRILQNDLERWQA